MQETTPQILDLTCLTFNDCDSQWPLWTWSTDLCIPGLPAHPLAGSADTGRSLLVTWALLGREREEASRHCL